MNAPPRAAIPAAPARARRGFLRAAGCAAATLGLHSLAGTAWAARAKALRLLCSGPAGSIPDLIARTLGESLATVLGQPTIVDNRPGAAGQISVAALKAAPADGSTLLLAQGAIATVHPSLYDRLAYDASVDLQPVSLAAETSLALAAGPAVPGEVTTLAGLIAWTRSHPAEANVGSPGTGTLPHLLAAMLFGEERVSWQHVAYSGGPPAVTDLLGGRIAALVLPEGLLRQHHASGRIRIVATSGPARSAFLPEVASFSEQGRRDLVVKEWFAFFAPGPASSEIVATHARAVQDAVARPEVSAVFAQAGMTPASCSPSVLSARIDAEQRQWRHVLRAHGIHAE